MTFDEFLTHLEAWTKANSVNWKLLRLDDPDALIRCDRFGVLCCPITAEAGLSALEWSGVASDMNLTESEALRIVEAADNEDRTDDRLALLKACRLKKANQ